MRDRSSANTLQYLARCSRLHKRLAENKALRFFHWREIVFLDRRLCNVTYPALRLVKAPFVGGQAIVRNLTRRRYIARVISGDLAFEDIGMVSIGKRGESKEPLARAIHRSAHIGGPCLRGNRYGQHRKNSRVSWPARLASLRRSYLCAGEAEAPRPAREPPSGRPTRQRLPWQ